MFVRKIPLKLRLAIFFIFTILLLPHIFNYSIRKGIPSSQAVYDRNGKLLRLSLADDEKYRFWVPLSKMPTDLITATLLKEDKYFWFHPGLNPISLVKAFNSTYIKKNKKIGASTITMQLVRIKYHMETDTILGKLKQISMAIFYDLIYTKKEILELYLNLAPYGGNIEGVGAASLIYFSKDVKNLILPEIMILVVMPQNPSAIGTYKIENERLKLFANWIKKYPANIYRKDVYRTRLILNKQSDLPFLAPHFVDSIVQEYPNKIELYTTLDLKLQQLIETQIKNYIEQKTEIGIHNAAAILVDANTMEVLASIGSVNYLSKNIQGQVKGTKAKRSPGSTIKPFMYALAIDQGLIHQKSILKDSPFGIGGFTPDNFDGEFHGPLTVENALIQSRNVPAVQVSVQLQNPDLYDFLKNANIDLPQPREYYGMALVLGSAEMTMEDLIKLYAMLDNEGIIRPLRYLSTDRVEDGHRLLSRESCFIIKDILKKNPRMDQHYQAEWTKYQLPVYWKTGTSFGFKDAWAVGFFGPYVLAVWIGNFNGVGNPSFVGIKASAPLFFQIIDAIKAIQPDLEQIPIYEALDLEKVKVCATSGQIPNNYCSNLVNTWFIPGCSPIKKCEIHRAIPIDIKTGLRVTEDREKGVRLEVFEFWPSDILKIFRMAGIPRKVPPPFHPSCSPDEKGYYGLPPKITSPQRGLVYHYRIKTQLNDSITLSAVSDADVLSLCWFANKQYLGKVLRDKIMLWKPNPGRYVVRVVDDQGRSDSSDIIVQAIN